MRVAADATAVRSLNHGIGTYVAGLLTNLVAEEPNNRYVAFASRSAIASLHTLGLPHDRVAFAGVTPIRLLRLFWEQLVLARTAVARKADILWGCHNSLPWFRTCPQVVTIHDLGVFTVPGFYPRTKVPYFRWAIAHAVRQADVVVADSHFTARELTTVLGVAEAKIRIIHCGIGPQYQPCAQVHDMEPMRRRYGLPDAFIFFLGVLEPKKNLERTISAYADLRRRRKDVPRLVIGGGRSFGWKNRRVFALARSLGDAVLFTDFIAPADLPAVYGMAEMLVFPSLYEGFGLPPVEAMACGTPVISSNRAALPEIAGDAALLVDPLRTDDIADAMERILVDSGLRAELQERGRINARRFDWRQAARTMLKVFDEAVGGTS